MKMAIHLIVKNNETTIRRTLESVLPLSGEILVVDIGSTDSTAAICRKYGARINRLSFNDDYSEIRNNLMVESRHDWNLSIEPWESILRGQDILAGLVHPAAHRLSVIQGDVITKQVRIWHKSVGAKFVNPVYESIPEKATDLPAYLHSVGGRDPAENLDLVRKWRGRAPLATEPLYYEACTLLVQKKWKEFMNVATHYLFQERKAKMSLAMTGYYCAMVSCYMLKDYASAARYLIPCLAEKPTMAEFWCLLGDVYYAAKQYAKASAFYENGMILGGRRLKADEWPFEISKYKEYPMKMMAACAGINSSSRQYSGQVQKSVRSS